MQCMQKLQLHRISFRVSGIAHYSINCLPYDLGIAMAGGIGKGIFREKGKASIKAQQAAKEAPTYKGA